ncbi:unnamed protein product [Blepharisma stoltei]|uniref:Uncharacterized protein n=1 Tax=Blepharisma stoltei TaxID=1481888 RepID=A0AAU9JW36_9CILI|nr:unnamed protein product [Blepharisma stoltei]
MTQILKSSLGAQSLNSILKKCNSFPTADFTKSDIMGTEKRIVSLSEVIEEKKVIQPKKQVTFKDSVAKKHVNCDNMYKEPFVNSYSDVFQEVNSKMSAMLGSQRDFLYQAMEGENAGKNSSRGLKCQIVSNELKLKEKIFEEHLGRFKIQRLIVN